MEKDILIGLIGFGEIGKAAHFPALNEKFAGGALKLVIIGDSVANAQYQNIPFTANYQEILSINDIRAISIATPPNTHYQIAMEAIQAGKHVMVEKPPALTLEQLEKMESASSNQRVVLFTAFHTRYRDEVYAARDFLKGKQVREIEIMRYQHVKTYHPDAFTNGWILKKAIAGGGIVIDDGTNFIASTRCAVGDNMQFVVTNSNIKVQDCMEVETEADIDFKFGENGIGNMKMDWLYEGQEVATITLRTDQEECVIDLLKAEFFVNGKSLTQGTRGESRVDISGEYHRVYEHFQRCILEGKSFVSKAELEFVLQAYRLAKIQ